MDGFSILILVTCAACLAAGVVALARGRGRADRLWFAAGAVVTAAWLFAVGSVRVSQEPLVAMGRAYVASSLAPVLPVPWLFVALLFARDRAGEALRRHRLMLAVVLVASGAACWAGAAGRLVFSIDETGGAYTVALSPLGRYATLYLIALSIVSLFQLEATARASRPELLAVIKHALIGLAAAIIYHVFVLSTALLYSRVSVAHLTAGAVPVLAGLALVSWSVARRRLDDARVAVGRPVFYTSLTAFLAGAYLLVLGAAGWVAREQGWGPSLATTVSLVFAAVLILVVFIFSSRTRRAIRRFIDTNFYINRFDYRREWSRTSRALSGATREPQILERVLDLLRDTFDADPVVGATYERAPDGVRVRARRGLTPELVSAVTDASLLHALETRGGTVRIGAATRDPLLREWAERHGAALAAGGYDVAVPLGANGDTIGAVLLSGRGSRRPGRYTHEDLLLLEMIGRQAGSTLVASRLSAELSATREMESLHRVSSFVVHDLKNSVAGLRLMAGNAETHLGDPEFQRDLIRSVADTADGIQRVIDRVSGHADGGSVMVRSSSSEPFAAVAADAARRAGVGGAGSPVRVTVDADGAGELGRSAGAVGTVLENLLRNAADAMAGAGSVEISAASGADGRLTVRVADTGPGVPRDLIESGELFAPFRSEGEAGLGIGLYQCRTILEELGGGIDVVPGDGGAVFELWVPREGV